VQGRERVLVELRVEIGSARVAGTIALVEELRLAVKSEAAEVEPARVVWGSGVESRNGRTRWRYQELLDGSLGIA
jgi:hypothetical protein